MLMSVEWKIGDVVGYVQPPARNGRADGSPKAPANDDAMPVDWYAVLTKPAGESTADTYIREERGFLCFFPKRLVEIRLPGKAKKRATVTRPLYPRYVFAGIPATDADRTGQLYSTKGVQTVLGLGGPLRIRQVIMEQLMRRADSNGVVEITEVPADHLFSAGQTVRFKSESVFHPYTGTIDRVDSNGRIKIWIQGGGNAIPVEVHYSELLPPESV